MKTPLNDVVPDADHKQMFGYSTCVYGGNMFAFRRVGVGIGRIGRRLLA